MCKPLPTSPAPSLPPQALLNSPHSPEAEEVGNYQPRSILHFSKVKKGQGEQEPTFVSADSGVTQVQSPGR